MSFAIEVPGDANPLTLESLVRALQWATSSDHTQRQTAGQQLASWAEQGGYYSSLQTVFLDRSLPKELRFLAIIQMKNGIDRFWRLYATAKNGIKAEEKAQIRPRLFQGSIEEDDKTLALHNALVTAKVIRIDYPAEWPDALPSLIAMLRSYQHGNPQHLYGALLVLLRVVKELGSARLRKSQTALQSVTPELVYVLGEIYSEKSTAWIAFLSNGQVDGGGAEIAAMHNSLIALKILRRLVIMGYERPHGDNTVEQFWTMSQNQFGQLLGFVSYDSNIPQNYQELVGKHLLQFAKLHIDMAEGHAASFAVLPNSLSLVHAYWDLVAKFAEVFDQSEGIRHGSGGGDSAKSKMEGPVLERLALKGLLLLRACVRIAFQPVQTFKYRSPETKAEQDKARSIIKDDLLKPDLVVQIVNAIITHLFIFRTSDLEAWEVDPEEWEQQEASEGNAYEWEVRPCAEKLFLDLLTYFKDLLVPPLLSYFETAQSPSADVATKEAVYTAMGHASAHVVGRFDFDSVLASTIVNDAQQHGEHYKILRRRIAILISKWAPVKLSETSRPIAYQIFRHFLNPNDETNDLVVRITAARELRSIADDLEFDAEAFLPYTSDVLSQLVQLIQNVGVDETKLALLEPIRILVIRMEDKVSQFGDQLMTALPEVWERSGSEEYMIKQAVIAIFSALVMSMGVDSQRYLHLMVPLLSEAATYGSDLHAHLIDESLELWNAILMQSSAPLLPELVNMIELVLPLVTYQQETALQALSAIESYIIISPSSILEDRFRRPTLLTLAKTLDSRSREQVRMATTSIEYMIRSAVELGGPQGVTVIIQDMVESGFTKRILDDLHQAWEAHQTTGPNRAISKLNTITEGDFFAVLARVALAEPTLFTQMLTHFGVLDQVWTWLLAEWLSHARHTDDRERLKLYLLGLTRLLELPSPVQEMVLHKLQDYFDLWESVLAELRENGNDTADALLWTAQDVDETEYDTPKTIAERHFLAKDPIHTVHALAFIRMRLDNLVERVGGPQAFEEQWAVNLEDGVLQRFNQLVSALPQCWSDTAWKAR